MHRNGIFAFCPKEKKRKKYASLLFRVQRSVCNFESGSASEDTQVLTRSDCYVCAVLNVLSVLPTLARQKQPQLQKQAQYYYIISYH